MAQWNPFVDMENLRREVDRAFEEFGMTPGSARSVAFLPGSGPRRYPLVNLLEDQEHVYVEALTPGIDPQSLNVSIMRNNLTLSGEKTRIPADVQPESFHRSERSAGKFVRTFELPTEVDENNIRAEYRNGLLIITLPKAERAKPRQVEVKLG
ncbi:MAG TPA: Hsp20/alpha crystallin family protein [Candidatus Binatia bacterium]|nr:Hsp20/alpha crystallin family protein [Candidatus Binatia bacterium]